MSIGHTGNGHKGFHWKLKVSIAFRLFVISPLKCEQTGVKKIIKLGKDCNIPGFGLVFQQKATKS